MSNEPFFTNAIQRPTHRIPRHHFQESIDAMNESKQDNPLDHYIPNVLAEPPICKHPRVETWCLTLCDTCHTKLSPERGAREIEYGRVAAYEDSIGMLPGERLIYERDLAPEFKTDHKAEGETKCNRPQESHSDFIHSLGVRIDWLVAFTFDHDCWNWPTWKVKRDIIVPFTSKYNRSRYANNDSICPKPYRGPSKVFMSHCWSGLWGDLVMIAAQGARMDRYVWIDVFAVRQYAGNMADLDFRGVISKCTAMIVCVPFQEGLTGDNITNMLINNIGHGSKISLNDYFSDPMHGEERKKCLFTKRLWCVVEMAAAVTADISVIIKIGKCKQRRQPDTYSDEIPDFTFEPTPLEMQPLVIQHAKTAEEYMEAQKNNTHYSLGFNFNVPVYWFDGSGGNKMANILIDYGRIDVELSECCVKDDYDREIQCCKTQKGGLAAINEMVTGALAGAHISEFGQLAQFVEAAICGEPEALWQMLQDPSFEREAVYFLLLILCKGGRATLLYQILTNQMAQNCQQCIQTFSDQWICKLIGAASTGGHNNCIKVLIHMVRPEIDLSSYFEDETTPLYFAAQYERLETIQFLLDQNVNPNIGNSAWSPLLVAAWGGKTKSIEMLLKVPSVNVNWTTTKDDNNTALSYSCFSGKIECVRLLLSHPEIDVSIRSSDKLMTPFSGSVFARQTSIVKLFLNYHAQQKIQLDVNIEVKKNYDNKEDAENCYSVLMLHYIHLICGDVDDRHIFNDRLDQEECVSMLLKLPELDVNKKGKDGKNFPLLLLCSKQPIDGSESGQKIHYKDKYLIELLKRSDLLVNQRTDDQKETPLVIACITGHLSAVKLLLQDERIQINKSVITKRMKSFYPYPEEWTALLWMCETSVTDQNVVNSKVGRVGSLAIIRELLLHSKIDVNWEDTNCRTSMLLLKFSDKEPHVKKEIKEMLIEAGGRKWESTNCYVVSMVCKILWANCCKCCLPSRSQEMLRRMVLEDVEPIVSAEKAEENVNKNVNKVAPAGDGDVEMGEEKNTERRETAVALAS